VFSDTVEKIEKELGGLDKFTRGYETYGIHVNPDNSITCMEWAPGAAQLYLTGEFSNIYFELYCTISSNTYKLKILMKYNFLFVYFR
jgi:1,4-alpha-glucan branching enzyme